MKFDGDPIKYPMFMRCFGVQVDRFCYDDSERQEFLRCSLSEEIQRNLGYLLMHPGGYQQCLYELRDRYGSPRVIAAACSRALFQLAAFKDHDFKALNFFASSLRSVVATLLLSGFDDEMKSQATLQQVVAKLPPCSKTSGQTTASILWTICQTSSTWTIGCIGECRPSTTCELEVTLPLLPPPAVSGKNPNLKAGRGRSSRRCLLLRTRSPSVAAVTVRIPHAPVASSRDSSQQKGPK